MLDQTVKTKTKRACDPTKDENCKKKKKETKIKKRLPLICKNVKCIQYEEKDGNSGTIVNKSNNEEAFNKFIEDYNYHIASMSVGTTTGQSSSSGNEGSGADSGYICL